MSLAECDKLWRQLQSALDSTSLLKKHLKFGLYLCLREKTTSLGGTFADVIRPGCLNPDAPIGVISPDQEGYTAYNRLLDKIIKDLHNVEKIEHPATDYGEDRLKIENLDPQGSRIPYTHVQLSRNLDGFGFTPVMLKLYRLAVEKKCSDALKSLEKELEGTYYHLDNMPKEVKEELIEGNLYFSDTDKYMKDAGVYNDWPIGRGIFFNRDKSLVAWINRDDHLRLTSYQKNGELKDAYVRLVNAIRHLEKKQVYARKKGLGFLTLSPANVGTTLRVSMHVRLPFLSTHPDFQTFCEKFHVQAESVEHMYSETQVGMTDITNARRLNLSEYEVIQEMAIAVEALLEEDKRLFRESKKIRKK